MSRAKKTRRRPAPPPDACGLTVCHGCCCARDGYGRRDAEAVERLDRFRAAAAAVEGTVTVANCLGPCADADVVVVRPSALGRRDGGRPVWLCRVTDVEADLVIAWVEAGGPGAAPMPELLATKVFVPARRHREELEGH
ncbi:hypothetical protein SAMN05421595_3000 [Austwickia chelonae]|uniref:(2Fe-2S) ferredoxin domain-containing protein n=1 Tax=Austwickia chelonae NBRC 105200 TaxID=1184607 RepID=K6VQX3_9MICO|nr:hypothetical protein [Austwickia chelonae]GAB79139.1 hypothetical protein AUCHE_20_00100 [Austwickia chelonae NBRC 105200]SEW42599.1 hypothetical protein SAMN05421595_3000 [Austwickia chelonae]